MPNAQPTPSDARGLFALASVDEALNHQSADDFSILELIHHCRQAHDKFVHVLGRDSITVCAEIRANQMAGKPSGVNSFKHSFVIHKISQLQRKV